MSQRNLPHTRYIPVCYGCLAPEGLPMLLSFAHHVSCVFCQRTPPTVKQHKGTESHPAKCNGGARGGATECYNVLCCARYARFGVSCEKGGCTTAIRSDVVIFIVYMACCMTCSLIHMIQYVSMLHAACTRPSRRQASGTMIVACRTGCTCSS